MHLNYIHPFTALESSSSQAAGLACSGSCLGQTAALGVNYLKVPSTLPPSPAFSAQVSAPGLLALGRQALCPISQQRDPRSLRLVASLHKHSVNEAMRLVNPGRTKELGPQGKFSPMVPTFQRQITGGISALDTWDSVRVVNWTPMDRLQGA